MYNVMYNVSRFVLYAVSGLPEEQIYTLECRNSIKLFFDDEKEKKVSSRGILDKKVRVGRAPPNIFWPNCKESHSWGV